MKDTENINIDGYVQLIATSGRKDTLILLTIIFARTDAIIFISRTNTPSTLFTPETMSMTPVLGIFFT